MSHYLTSPGIQICYDAIKTPDSKESAVDWFWLNTLILYFKPEKQYLIGVEQGPIDDHGDKRSDIILTTIRSGAPKKVVILEDKRRLYETQSARWLEAVEQLTEYLKLTRMEQYPNVMTLYGGVAIGTYVRFYVFDVGNQELRDYIEGREDPFELREDEEAIHNILVELVQRASV